jgi:ketosteroid isomerase-like protein
MTPKEIVHQYYDNLAQKNESWQSLFAEDITFSDSAMNMNEAGKDGVSNSFNQFLKSVEDLRVKLMVAENETVCAIVSYDYVNQHEEKMNQDVAEVWQVKNGKLSSLVLYFDYTAFRNFMRR